MASSFVDSNDSPLSPLNVSDEFFHCDICRRRYKLRKYLARHIKTHLQKKPYRCHYCDKPFIEHYQLMKHAYAHKFENDFSGQIRLMMKARQRTYCNNDNDNNSTDLVIDRYSLPPTKTYPCPQCGKEFHHKGNVTRHLKIHERKLVQDTQRTPFTTAGYDVSSPDNGYLSCVYCNRVFKQKFYLQKHMERHSKQQQQYSYYADDNNNNNNNSEERRFVCDVCDRPFARKDTLTRHARLHSNERPFECDKCDKTFRMKEHLNRHSKRHTDDLKTFVCKHCHRCFDGKANFVRHFEAHSVDKTTRCKICQRNFEKHGDLTEHIERKHRPLNDNNVFVCGYCYERFNNKYFLSRHMESHVTVTPYRCVHCNKYFKLESHLIDHMKMDQDARPYSCTFCAKTFKQNTHLNVHIKSQHDKTDADDSVVRCEYCDKTFVRTSRLKRHIARVHRRRRLSEEIVDDIDDRNEYQNDDDDEERDNELFFALEEEQRTVLYPICTVTTNDNIYRNNKNNNNNNNDDDDNDDKGPITDWCDVNIDYNNEHDNLLRITLDYLLRRNQANTDSVEKLNSSYYYYHADELLKSTSKNTTGSTSPATVTTGFPCTKQQQRMQDVLCEEYLNCFKFKDHIDDLAQQIVDCISTHFMCSV